MPLVPGTRLGTYQVTGQLGSGGMGEVYRARDSRLGREVALKVLSGELAADAERRRRFEHEARAASALNHPNIVVVYDIGAEGDVHFLAMELVEGRTLRQLLAAGPLPAADVLRYGVAIAEGLAKAHAQGICHRDLKPENVMISVDGYVKVLDFGLAKLTGPVLEGSEDQSTIAQVATRAGTLLGTVEYMSPEQAGGGRVDFRTDQFALGAMLYEMATGQFAFRRETSVQTLASIIEDDPRPVESVARDPLPAPLIAIIRTCLRKDPAERYASTERLAEALRMVRPAAAAAAPPPAAVARAPAAPEPARTPEYIPASAAVRAPFTYHVQIRRGGIKSLDEPTLRQKLRANKYDGLELVRRDDETDWRPLYETEVYRQEVPHRGDPRWPALRKRLKSFGAHLAFYLGFGALMIAEEGLADVWPPLAF